MKSHQKIKTPAQLKPLLDDLKAQGKRIVFTNGCFDLLHPGHVRYLERARQQGDVLVVALNTDESVRKLKGENRPIVNQADRCEVVAGLGSVDFVTTFDEATPLQLIELLVPDVLVKGGDWTPDRIVGRGVVEAAGGKVLSINYENGFSTTAIIDRIRTSTESSSA